jgi:hypothetical protein
LPSRTTARGQVCINLRLIYFIHVEQPVGGSPRVCSVLEIFAKNACALFVPAPEEIPAAVVFRRNFVPLPLRLVGIVCHRFLLMFKEKRIDCGGL